MHAIFHTIQFTIMKMPLLTLLACISFIQDGGYNVLERQAIEELTD